MKGSAQETTKRKTPIGVFLLVVSEQRGIFSALNNGRKKNLTSPYSFFRHDFCSAKIACLSKGFIKRIVYPQTHFPKTCILISDEAHIKSDSQHLAISHTNGLAPLL